MLPCTGSNLRTNTRNLDTINTSSPIPPPPLPIKYNSWCGPWSALSSCASWLRLHLEWSLSQKQRLHNTQTSPIQVCFSHCAIAIELWMFEYPFLLPPTHWFFYYRSTINSSYHNPQPFMLQHRPARLLLRMVSLRFLGGSSNTRPHSRRQVRHFPLHSLEIHILWGVHKRKIITIVILNHSGLYWQCMWSHWGTFNQTFQFRSWCW